MTLPGGVFNGTMIPYAPASLDNTLPGYSTGYAIAAMEKLAAERLPDGFGFEWTDLAYQEKLDDMTKGGQGIDPTATCVSPGMPRVMVGYSTLEQLEYAARSIEKGPLPKTALDCIGEIQRGFVGEPR